MLQKGEIEIGSHRELLAKAYTHSCIAFSLHGWNPYPLSPMLYSHFAQTLK